MQRLSFLLHPQLGKELFYPMTGVLFLDLQLVVMLEIKTQLLEKLYLCLPIHQELLINMMVDTLEI